MGNDRNCSTNCVGMFGVPNLVIWVRFSTLAAPVVPGPEKVLKNRPKHLFSVLMRNDKNCVSNNVCMFRVQNCVTLAWFSTFSRPGGTEVRKVVKTRPNYFSTVLTGNYTICTTNCVGLFGLRNIVIRVRLSTLAAPLVPSPGKLVKIRPTHSFPLLMRNDKNCIPKSVGTFWALNRVIWDPFSTFPAPLCPDPKSHLNLTETFFLPYWWKTIRIVFQKVWAPFRR